MTLEFGPIAVVPFEKKLIKLNMLSREQVSIMYVRFVKDACLSLRKDFFWIDFLVFMASLSVWSMVYGHKSDQIFEFCWVEAVWNKSIYVAVYIIM